MRATDYVLEHAEILARFNLPDGGEFSEIMLIDALRDCDIQKMREL